MCHFKLRADMVRGGVIEFVYDADRPSFLKRKLMDLVWTGTGKSQFMIAQVDWCLFMCQERLISFSNVKRSITPNTLKLVYKVGGFAGSMGRNVDGTCFAEGLVARKALFRGGKGTRIEVDFSGD